MFSGLMLASRMLGLSLSGFVNFSDLCGMLEHRMKLEPAPVCRNAENRRVELNVYPKLAYTPSLRRAW